MMTKPNLFELYIFLLAITLGKMTQNVKSTVAVWHK